MTPFLDHKDNEGILPNPMSILRMRVEMAKVPWIKLLFEIKSQRNPLFADWMTKLLSDSVISNRMNQVGIKEP